MLMLVGPAVLAAAGRRLLVNNSCRRSLVAAGSAAGVFPVARVDDRPRARAFGILGVLGRISAELLGEVQLEACAEAEQPVQQDHCRLPTSFVFRRQLCTVTIMGTFIFERKHRRPTHVQHL
jgi:hypothetical protein